MKWSIYKRMSKEHKEEYNHKFRENDYPFLSQMFLALMGFVTITYSVVIGVFFLMGSTVAWFYSISQDYKERIWLKKRGYTDKNKDDD